MSFDPFYNPTIKPNMACRIIGLAKESDQYLGNDLSERVVTKMLNTYAPLKFYRALRIATMQAALTTDSLSSPDAPHPSLPMAVLDPRNSDLLDARKEPNKEEAFTRCLVRVLLASIIEIGVPKPADLVDPYTTDPLTSPAAAEQYQNLTSAWSGEATAPWAPSSMQQIDFGAMHDLDTGSGRSRLKNTTLLPVLLPTDRISHMHPNKPYRTTSDQYRYHPAIPLAWTWDPRIAFHSHDDIQGETKEDKWRAGVEAHSYAMDYDPLDEDTKLVAHATKYGMGFKPEHDAPDRVPEWRYAILEVDSQDTSPTHLPDAPIKTWGPMTESHAGSGIYKLSASVRQARVVARLNAGVSLPGESLEAAWWGADAASYAMRIGIPRREALAFAGDMNMGTEPPSLVPGVMPGTDDSHLTQTYRAARQAFPGRFPAYGHYAALQSGMRYLMVSLMNRHFSAATGISWPEADQQLRPPSAGEMQILSGIYGKKNARRRRDNDRRPEMPFLPRRGNRPVPRGTSNINVFFRDYVGSSDLTLSRYIIAPGALSVVETMLKAALGGYHGPVVKRWVDTVFEQLPALALVQEMLIKQEAEVIRKTNANMLRATLSRQREVNANAHKNQVQELHYLLPMALTHAMESGEYAQYVSRLTPEQVLSRVDTRAASIRASTRQYMNLLDKGVT